MKTCSKCKDLKPLNDFGKNLRATDKLSYSCKLCRKTLKAKWFKKVYVENKESFSKWYKNNPKLAKNAHKNWFLMKKYGISLEEYEAMIVQQNNVCAICKRSETATLKKTGTTWKLSIDHCHITNKIRGLLCSNCNTALGLFKDSVTSLLSAIDYLRKSDKI